VTEGKSAKTQFIAYEEKGRGDCKNGKKTFDQAN